MNANAELELAPCPQCQKPGPAPASAHLRDRLCSSECVDAYFADSSHFAPGDGATVTIGSDCYPATIISVTRCRIVVRRDRVARANLFLPDAEGETFAFRITKWGKWKSGSFRLRPGERYAYTDPHF